MLPSNREGVVETLQGRWLGRECRRAPSTQLSAEGSRPTYQTEGPWTARVRPGWRCVPTTPATHACAGHTAASFRPVG